jgi:CRP/FNR family transcriptional regulator, anaerobic regulatory protein
MNIPISYFSRPLSPALKDAYLERIRACSFASHRFLLKAGEICRHIYFVESGLLRCYYRRGNKEISSCFAQEGAYCWSAASFLLQQPGIEYIQVVEPSIVCMLSYDSLQCISLDFPQFDMLKQEVTRRHLLDCESKMQAMWMQQSPQRLAWFVRRFPGLLEKARAKHIASYLGITEVMLSRLRHHPAAYG